MIQRIQTIYLFLAAIICIAFLFIPIAEADNIITANSNTISGALCIASGLLSLITIFLYKNRKLQIRLCLIIISLLVFELASIYYDVSQLSDEHTLKATIVTPLLAVIFLILALRGIRKDEQLVRSMDRFR